MRLFVLPILLWMATTSAMGQSDEQKYDEQKYKVGPGDLLRISVLEVEGFLGDYRVDVGGKLQLPLLGELKVHGELKEDEKTLVDVRNLIYDALKDDGFVKNPQVFVDIVEVVYKPIRVIGAVNRPGKITSMSQNLFLLDVLAEVGGLLDTATDTVMIMRKGANDGKPIRVSYTDLVFEGKENHPIWPGDTIAVPVKKSLIISVLGEVNRQGQLMFGGATEVTILRVIAAAGGFTDYAKRTRISVRRRVNGKVTNIDVDVRKIQEGNTEDMELQHDDVVIVP